MKLRRAWALPVAVAVGIAAGVVAPGAFAADPHPSLPHRSAAQLVAAVEHSGARAVAGNFRTVADLGLPNLPDSDTGGNQFVQVLTGTADWHVWDEGLTGQRLALLGQGREFDTIDNDGIFWTWNSTTQTATREIIRLPANRAGHHAGDHGGHRPARHRGTQPAPFLLPGLTGPAGTTPMQLARHLLRSIDPSTVVTVGATVRVAGRPAYRLDLTPRTAATLIGQVRIAVDAATGVALQVQVVPRGSDLPAFTAGFTTVSFAPIDPSVFRFRPPAGAKVRVQRLLDAVRQPDRQPRVYGSGWAAVAAVPVAAPHPTGIVRDATSAVPEGRLLRTRLLSVLLDDDGRVLVGAVPPGRILTLAARPAPAAR